MRVRPARSAGRVEIKAAKVTAVEAPLYETCDCAREEAEQRCTQELQVHTACIRILCPQTGSPRRLWQRLVSTVPCGFDLLSELKAHNHNFSRSTWNLPHTGTALSLR